jgi:hypothetical protein
MSQYHALSVSQTRRSLLAPLLFAWPVAAMMYSSFRQLISHLLSRHKENVMWRAVACLCCLKSRPSHWDLLRQTMTVSSRPARTKQPLDSVCSISLGASSAFSSQITAMQMLRCVGHPHHNTAFNRCESENMWLFEALGKHAEWTDYY